MANDAQGTSAQNTVSKDAMASPLWWESKLFILVVGSLLIPLALSVFQHHYERVKWIAQSRYDAQHSRAVAMKEFLSQLADIEETVLEFRSIALQFPQAPNDETRAALYHEFTEATISYHQKMGKATGNLSVFPDRSSLRGAFDAYRGGSEEILRQAAAIMASRKSNRKSGKSKTGYFDAGDPANKIAMDTTALSQKQYASVNAIAFRSLEEIEASLEK